MTDVTYRLEISGRVQGVYYRGSMVSQAHALGLRGWVRNRQDGSVEAMVQGDAVAVSRLIEWSRRGPGGALVTGVNVHPAEGDFTGFKQVQTR